MPCTGRSAPFRARADHPSRQQNKPDTAGIEQDDTPRGPPAEPASKSTAKPSTTREISSSTPERIEQARSSSTPSRTPDHHTCASERASTSIQPNTPTEDPTPERAQRDAANGIQQTTVGRPSNPAPNPGIQRDARTTGTARTRNASSSRTRTFEYVPATNRPRKRTDTQVVQARRADHRRPPRTLASPVENIEQYATPTGIERRRAPADHTD